jgi:hypothetical protein
MMKPLVVLLTGGPVISHTFNRMDYHTPVGVRSMSLVHWIPFRGRWDEDHHNDNSRNGVKPWVK